MSVRSKIAAVLADLADSPAHRAASPVEQADAILAALHTETRHNLGLPTRRRWVTDWEDCDA